MNVLIFENNYVDPLQFFRYKEFIWTLFKLYNFPTMLISLDTLQIYVGHM